MTGPGFNPFRHLTRDLVILCLVALALGAAAGGIATWLMFVVDGG